MINEDTDGTQCQGGSVDSSEFLEGSSAVQLEQEDIFVDGTNWLQTDGDKEPPGA
jgi:hypothetical protein